MCLELVVISFLVRLAYLWLIRTWVFYLLILFYLGGLIILFLYLISLLNIKKLEAFYACNPRLGMLLFLRGFVVFEKIKRFEIRRIFYLEYGILMLAGVMFLGLVLVVKLVEFNSGSLKCYRDG